MKLKFILALVSMILLAGFASAATISISPGIAYDNDNLVCSVDSNSNAYTYEWYLGSDYKSTGATLDSSLTNVGETWTCKVFLPPTPWTTKIFIGSAERAISATPVLNNIPTAPTITLSLSEVYANSIVAATAVSTDADNDALTYEYRYERSGSVLSNNDTLDCWGICFKNDVIDVYARAYDGQDYSAWSTASFTILNSPIAYVSLSYSPLTVYRNTTVDVSADSYDLNGDYIYYLYVFVVQDYDGNLINLSYFLNETDTFQFDLNAINFSGYNDTYMGIGVIASDGPFYWDTVLDEPVNTSAVESDYALIDIEDPTTPITPPTNQTTFSYCPINSSNIPVHIVEVVNEDSIRDNEYDPLENFKVKVKVGNDADKSKTVYVKAVIVSDNRTVSDTEVSEEIKVGSDSEKTVELNMTIPLDLDEGTYDLYIKVYDESNRTNCEEKVIPFTVTRDENKVIFKDSEFSPSDTVQCGDIITFSGVLANLGTEDEEKVKIVYEDDLKNKFEDTINDLDWGSESRKIEFFPLISKNATEVKHKVTLTIYYNYDDDDSTYDKKITSTYYFTVSGGCKAITPPLTNITTNITTTTQTQTSGSSFSDFISNNWKSMLIIAEIVAVFVIVMLILSASKLL